METSTSAGAAASLFAVIAAEHESVVCAEGWYFNGFDEYVAADGGGHGVLGVSQCCCLQERSVTTDSICGRICDVKLFFDHCPYVQLNRLILIVCSCSTHPELNTLNTLRLEKEYRYVSEQVNYHPSSISRQGRRALPMKDTTDVFWFISGSPTIDHYGLRTTALVTV
ncbi:uncharacterized protein EDB91DRAFT_1085228 [Suillus paluster]|uniref:uncharacterized protein n=1 Tax=Suillus paluster TaxID=48578 RepID=UPI001B85B4EB|nr:uncharacterized protein EDB91DRAFT_1090087 [Suillus paluster]XP_041173242.1 uncharacterized protein EDB91DRAFT_1085228 [Suillus paluster]KAG1718366.1 hypothetical protein EDB91DRAFT_1090087 [Suillus paluster]KAG1730933.1 hypothetical protein EDB91DRAFT_1085228 [Suillus paluster]